MKKNYRGYYNSNFEELKGKTLTKIDVDGVDKLTFFCDDNSSYHMVYYSDCRASSSIEEIHGDLEDLIGNPILLAEEVRSKDPETELQAKNEYYSNYKYESKTWTFYKLSTIKGSVIIRWYGSSNGLLF